MEDKKTIRLRRHASSSDVDNSHRLRYPQFSPVSPNICEQHPVKTDQCARAPLKRNSQRSTADVTTPASQRRCKPRRRRRTDHYDQPRTHSHHTAHGSQARSSLPVEFSFASSFIDARQQPQQQRRQVSESGGVGCDTQTMSSDDEYEEEYIHYDYPQHPQHSQRSQNSSQDGCKYNGRKRSLYDGTAFYSSTGSDVGVSGGVASDAGDFASCNSGNGSSSSDDEVRQLLFPVLVVREPLSFSSKPPVGMRQRAPDVPTCLFLADRICIRCESLEECDCTQWGQSSYKRIRCNSRLRPSLDLEKMQVLTFSI